MPFHVTSNTLWRFTLLLTCQVKLALCSSCAAPTGNDVDPSTFLQTGARVDTGDSEMDKASSGHIERAVGSGEHSKSSSTSSPLLHPFDLSELHVKVPHDYTGNTPLPLVVMLHGYSSYPGLYIKLFGLQDRINADQFIQIVPPGSKDSAGYRSWQAWGRYCGDCEASSDNTCCGDFDVDYVRTIIYAATRNYNVDTKRIYVNGHSDGAAMAYRLACDAADIITAVMILAGSPPEANWKPGYECKPSHPISLLHIHGTEDTDVDYEGGGTSYKGAIDSVDLFANLNGCAKQDAHWFPVNANTKQSTGVATLQLSCYSYSNDTEVFHTLGCNGGVDVELWKVIGETHNPCFERKSYEKHSVSWLLRHSRSVRPNITAPSCVDKPLGWEDSSTPPSRCQEYAENNWCNSTGGYGAGWKDTWGWFGDYAVKGMSAISACCACGGGSKTSLLAKVSRAM